MCRELQAITDAVDPGSSRLALYSSVILHELHRAEFQLARRNFEREPPVVSAEVISHRVLESRVSLLKAIKILEPEPQFSSGSKMLELLRKSLYDCDIWRKSKGLTVPAWIELRTCYEVKPRAVLSSDISSPTSCRWGLLCFRNDCKQSGIRLGLLL